MKKSLKKTAAVVLAVATTAGIAATTSVELTNSRVNANNNIVVKAEGETSNFLNIKKYSKSVKLNDTFKMPEATFKGTGAEVAVTTYTVTTPTGLKFTNQDVTDGEFKVEEIGTYKISYEHNGYTGEISFESSVSAYSLELEKNSSNILPEKFSVEFDKTLTVPNVIVKDEDGEEYTDVKIEKVITGPTALEFEKDENQNLTNVIDFSKVDNLEEGFYTVSYYAYDAKTNAYLTETQVTFQAVNKDAYKNEFDLKLSYSSEKPTAVNVGKTIELPAITAKNGKETVNSYYSVEVYKNGSSTAIEEGKEDETTKITVIKKNEKGVYEFTADEVGARYTIKYLVKDALGNEETTSFVISTVEDTIKPTPIVVDAYTAGQTADLVNKDYSLKSTFAGDEAVYVKAIYAEDLATFSDEDYTFERRIEDSSRREVYVNKNFADANKELVFNYTGSDLDSTKYINVENVDLKEGTYYVYYIVKDANGNEGKVSYKFTIKDSNFDWKTENSETIKPVVKFNDTFFSSVDLGETIEFNEITATCEHDERLLTKVEYAYVVDGVEQARKTLELNEDEKYVIDTAEEDAEGAQKVVIYASATNDNDDAENNTTEISEEITLRSENLGTNSTIEVVEVDDAGYSYEYTQGEQIVLPDMVFADGADGVDSLNAEISIKCDLDGEDVYYTASNLMAIKYANYYRLSKASFVAATAGNYQVAVKVTDAAGNVVIKFLDYTVKNEQYSGSLRFANIGLSDTTLELGKSLKLTQATIYGTGSENYSYAVICESNPGSYELSNSEFKPKAVGEYKLKYVMFKTPAQGEDIQFIEDETIEFTVKVEDKTAPVVNVVWESENINGTEAKQNILPSYEVGTKILLPKVSASDMSGIDLNKSTITITSGKGTTKTIKLVDMNDEYSANGEMYYEFSLNAEYTIKYTIYDTQGNKNEYTKTIKVGDLVPPTIVVEDSIVDDTYSIGDKISIDLKNDEYITLSDNKDTLEESEISVKLYVDGVEVKKDSTSKDGETFDFTLTKAGEYELEFSIKDSAGWTTKEVKTFTIQAEEGSKINKTQTIGIILIVVSVAVLAGVVVYFIVSKKKMDRLYK